MSDKTGLDLLRVPFAPHLISKLPKPTKAQTDALKANFKLGARCTLCGGWHQPEVVHLDYVGHAALTDRLLDADPAWTWEPLAMSPEGLPVIDPLGGMWIKLTVCGVTRLGYGDAQGKEGPNAIKECIGDALRNAAMRFGAALELWHKGDLHKDEEEKKPDAKKDVAHSGPAIAFAELSADWQGYLRELAAEVENVCEQQSPEAARELVEDRKKSAEMEAEHIAGLWSLLSSKTRAKLKPKDEAYKAGQPVKAHAI